MHEAVHYINGGAIRSAHLDRRQDELSVVRAELRRRRGVLQQERRIILENFEDESDFDRQYGFP